MALSFWQTRAAGAMGSAAPSEPRNPSGLDGDLGADAVVLRQLAEVAEQLLQVVLHRGITRVAGRIGVSSVVGRIIAVGALQQAQQLVETAVGAAAAGIGRRRGRRRAVGSAGATRAIRFLRSDQ